MAGFVVAFEGLDQSGKQTQAERLAATLRGEGRRVEMLSFPEYHTAIGTEIGRALAGARDYAPDTLQLLYIANRYEFRPRIEAWLGGGAIVICDRYVASSVAYGEAQGLDAAWVHDVQRFLPAPALTVLLDIPPEVSLARKQAARDRFETLYQRRLPLRLVGIELSPLVPHDGQGLLFADPDPERAARLAMCKDEVRRRFGFTALLSGSALLLAGRMEHDRENFRMRTPCLTR